MGRHTQRKHAGIGLENNHPGCLWGILHILDYHQWRHVKKMLIHKRHGGGRHSVGQMQEHIDAEMDHSVIEGNMTEPIPATKSSMKARIKAFITEERSKKKGHLHPSSTTLSQSQVTRTDSTHHLEPSDQDPLAEVMLNVESPKFPLQDNENSPSTSTLDRLPLKASEEPVTGKKICEVCNTMVTMNHLGHSQVGNEHGKQLVENHTLLQEKLDKAKQALLEQKLIYATEHARDAPLYQSKEFLDALDIVNVNKELFLKVLQDQGSPLAHDFHGRQAFSREIGITKSMSFPVADLSGGGASGPSKSKHKSKKVGSHAKREGKLQVRIQAQKSAEFESAEDISELSTQLMDENQENADTIDDTSPGSPLQRKNGSSNQVVIKRFKDLKKRLKHAIRESRKESHRITMDAVFHKIPYGRKFSKDVNKEISCQRKAPAMDRGDRDSPASNYEIDHSGPVLRKGRVHHMRRTSSISDSLDRYCQLYECSFNKEDKYHISERVKLRTEEVCLPGWSAPKSMGRILSLPNLKSCLYLEDSYDGFSSWTPIRTVVDNTIDIESSFDEQKTLELLIDSENQMQLDAQTESGSQENLVKFSEVNPVIRDQVGSTSGANDEANAEVGLTIDNSGSTTIGDKASHHEQGIGSMSRLNNKLAEPSPISVLNSSFQENITSPAKCSISKDSLADQHYESSMDSPAMAESRFDLEEVKLPSKHLDSDSLHVQVDTKDKAEFNYVRDVLELSGFSRNEILWTWHSADRPVDPSVYDEAEVCLPHRHESSENEEGGGYCNHVLLFDLINEVLMEIYERSFFYWPMPLSSFFHIRPMPAGYHVLEEVWANISWYLSSRPELSQSLDYVVSRDLAKGDGWMNLQFDMKCVGLELEDLIFEDLLEELFELELLVT